LKDPIVSDNVSTIVVLDTETTDMDPSTGAEICEIGFVSLERLSNGKWDFGPGTWTFIETDAPFAPAARAAHHIDPAQCRPGQPRCIPRAALISSMKEMEKPGMMLYCAHNAPFDMKFLPELSLGVIDTYQCAKHLFPESPKFGNQVLRYYLDAEPPPDLLVGLGPHRSLYDAACTGAILVKMLALQPPAELVRLSTTPILLKTCNFGKHEGKPWSAVPIDYLHWMVRANDMYQNDVDMRYTVDHYLNRKVTQLPI
jgi:exodeoxyribonuclease X